MLQFLPMIHACSRQLVSGTHFSSGAYKAFHRGAADDLVRHRETKMSCGLFENLFLADKAELFVSQGLELGLTDFRD